MTFTGRVEISEFKGKAHVFKDATITAELDPDGNPVFVNVELEGGESVPVSNCTQASLLKAYLEYFLRGQS